MCVGAREGMTVHLFFCSPMSRSMNPHSLKHHHYVGAALHLRPIVVYSGQSSISSIETSCKCIRFDVLAAIKWTILGFFLFFQSNHLLECVFFVFHYSSVHIPHSTIHIYQQRGAEYFSNPPHIITIHYTPLRWALDPLCACNTCAMCIEWNTKNVWE